MEKSKLSPEEVEKYEKDNEWEIEVSNRYRGLKDVIFKDATKWKDGEIGDRNFQNSIYKSIDEFVIEHKSRLLKYLNSLKD
jgi:hypothetical protein